MKNLLIVILISTGMIFISEDIPPYEIDEYYEPTMVTDSSNDDSGYDTIRCDVKSVRYETTTSAYRMGIEPLINAMILVESEGNDSAYCRHEEAVGCLQIRPIMLAECNRILKLQKSSISYNLLDRWSREKSIEIFNIINKHHNKNATYEEIARFWNGGPKWADKGATKKYWEKVYIKLDEQYKKDEHSIDWFAKI